MARVVFHYTSKEHAAGILTDRRLRLGKDERLYFTDYLFARASDAARRLAIHGKPVEAVIALPEEPLLQLLSQPKWVDRPILGPSFTDGPATERWIGSEVPLLPDSGVWLVPLA